MGRSDLLVPAAIPFSSLYRPSGACHLGSTRIGYPLSLRPGSCLRPSRHYDGDSYSWSATHTLLPITVISISTWTRFLTPGIAQSSPDLGGAIEFPADPPVPLLCTSAASSTADISPTSHHYHPHHSVPDESVSYRQHSIPFHRHPEPLLHLYVHHTSTTYRLTIPVSARAISDIHTITSTLSGEAGANSHHQHDPNLTQSVAIEFQLKSGMASFSAWCEGGDEDEDESMGEKQARDCNWRAAGAGVGAGVEEKGRDGEEAGDREEDEGGQGRWMPIGDFTGGVAGVGGRCEVTGDREVGLAATANVVFCSSTALGVARGKEIKVDFRFCYLLLPVCRSCLGHRRRRHNRTTRHRHHPHRFERIKMFWLRCR